MAAYCEDGCLLNEIAALIQGSQGDVRNSYGMKFAESREKDSLAELGIQRRRLCSSSPYLLHALLPFSGKALTTEISGYSLDVRRQSRTSNSDYSSGSQPRRSGSDGLEKLNQS